MQLDSSSLTLSEGCVAENKLLGTLLYVREVAGESEVEKK